MYKQVFMLYKRAQIQYNQRKDKQIIIVVKQTDYVG